MAQFVLVHSPSVGPATWSGVADRLRESGHRTAVPSLLGVAESEPPFWPGVVAAVTAEQPRLPLSYYTEQVPAPDGWAGHRCGYLVFSEAYVHEADEARRRGWTVRSLPGEHLHQIIDPAGVAAVLVGIAG